MSTRIVPKAILPTANVAATCDFYARLGFEVQSYDDGYAWVRHDGTELLHLARTDGLEPAANPAALYLHVQDADDWHRRWSESGVPVGPLVDQPWGMREFVVYDPGGNRLRVGHNLE